MAGSAMGSELQHAMYHVAAGTPAKIARPGQMAQDHTVRADLSFTDEELLADPGSPPAEDAAPARWARKGWYVFRRGEWFLLVRGYHVDLEY